MKKISHLLYPWFVIVLALTAAMIVPQDEYQWLDPQITTTTTGPGDVMQRELVRRAASRDDSQESQSYLQKLKAALKRLRACLVDKNCSEQERREAVDMANNLLDLFLLSVGVGIVETGDFIERRMESWRTKK